MRKKHEEIVIELQGPEDPTLTPPPQRRIGLLLGVGFLTFVFVGVFGLIALQPELFVTAVQAFVGGF